MATTEYFHEVVKDKKLESSIDLEFGRSSFYGENTLYLIVDGKKVIMDTETAKKLIGKVVEVGNYLGFIE